MKKKVILLLVLALCLTGCGKKTEVQTPTLAPAETVPTVTAAQETETPAAPAATEAAQAQLMTEPTALPDGSLHVEVPDHLEIAFEVVNEVWMGAGTSELDIWSDGLVRDVRLEYGPLDPETGDFLSTTELYSNEVMGPNTLVRVYVDLVRGETALRLSYEGGQGPKEYYVTQAGEGGRVLLREKLEQVGGQAPGGLRAALAEEVDPAGFEILRSCELNTGGEEVYFYPSGNIRNFSLDLGSPDSSGLNFRIERNLCSLEKLNEGQAVKLTAFFPDGQPNLRVTYENDMGLEEYYVTQSGENGSVLLILTY